MSRYWYWLGWQHACKLTNCGYMCRTHTIAGDGWYTFAEGMVKLPQELEELRKDSVYGVVEHSKAIDEQKVLEWAAQEGQKNGDIRPMQTVHLCLRLRGGGRTRRD